MSDYSMTCSCGDVMKLEASSREDAIEKLQGMMTADAIKGHMMEKHPGDAIPTVEQIHGQIAQYTQLAMA